MLCVKNVMEIEDTNTQKMVGKEIIMLFCFILNCTVLLEIF